MPYVPEDPWEETTPAPASIAPGKYAQGGPLGELLKLYLTGGLSAAFSSWTQGQTPPDGWMQQPQQPAPSFLQSVGSGLQQGWGDFKAFASGEPTTTDTNLASTKAMLANLYQQLLQGILTSGGKK